jgi:hypothetical protein
VSVIDEDRDLKKVRRKNYDRLMELKKKYHGGKRVQEVYSQAFLSPICSTEPKI